MTARNFFSLLSAAFWDWVCNPAVLIFPLLLFAFLTLLSIAARLIAPTLTTTLANTLWLICYGLLSLCIIAYLLAAHIETAHLIVRKRTFLQALRSGFSAASAQGHANIIALLLFLVLYNCVLWAAYLFSFGIGKLFSLSVSAASILFIVALFAGFVGILLFFAFTSFSLVINKRSLRASIMQSILITKKNYLTVLSLVIFFFVLGQGIEVATGAMNLYLKELVNTLVLYPYVALVMARFLVEHSS